MSLDTLGRQALRFGGVGVLATLMHISVAWLASQTILTNPFQANAAGFMAAFALSYSGHFYFTFGLVGGHRQTMLRFLLVSLAGLALSNAIVWLITVRLGLSFTLSMAAVGIAVPVGSYLIARAWAFNRQARLDLTPTLLIIIAGAGAYLFYGAQLLNHDSSWYLVATRKWLDGATLYRDVMEINPPLAFFLTAPALWLADLLALDPTRAFQLYVILLAVGSLLAMQVLLARTSDLSTTARAAVLAACAVSQLVLPMGDFGQREHLMIILALPYVALLALAPLGLRVGLVATMAIALAAAVGLALKPHFLAAPLLLSLVCAWQARRLRPLFHPANLIIGGFCLAYLALIWVAFPLYFTTMLPLGALVYWAFGTGIAGVFLQAAFLIAPLAMFAALVTAGPGPHRAVALRWAAAAAGFGLAYLAQAKGWSYQLLPAIALLLPLLAFAAIQSATRLGTAAALLSALLLLGASTAGGPYRSVYVDVFGPELSRGEVTPALLMLSARLSAGFPLTTSMGALWVSRFPTQWVVPGAARLLASPECAAPGSCDAARAALDDTRRATVDDTLATPPDLIIADVQPRKVYFGDTSFDYLGWLQQDPRFAELFTQYRLDKTVGGHAIWRRTR